MASTSTPLLTATPTPPPALPPNVDVKTTTTRSPSDSHEDIDTSDDDHTSTDTSSASPSDSNVNDDINTTADSHTNTTAIEKAFDSVVWSFTEKSLCKFKFGKDITRWILTFYTNINSCVHVNGQYSQWFDVKRGKRQGDPLSPYLFLICAKLFQLNDTSE